MEKVFRDIALFYEEAGELDLASRYLELSKEYSVDNVLKQYVELVDSKVKDPKDIVSRMTPRRANLMHMTIGIQGEVGELADAIKKNVIYNQDLDITNIKEELGDIMFYVQGIISVLELDLGDILRDNMSKLNRRYPKGYSDYCASIRLDKKGE